MGVKFYLSPTDNDLIRGSGATCRWSRRRDKPLDVGNSCYRRVALRLQRSGPLGERDNSCREPTGLNFIVVSQTHAGKVKSENLLVTLRVPPYPKLLRLVSQRVSVRARMLPFSHGKTTRSKNGRTLLRLCAAVVERAAGTRSVDRLVPPRSPVRVWRFRIRSTPRSGGLRARVAEP